MPGCAPRKNLKPRNAATIDSGGSLLSIGFHTFPARSNTKSFDINDAYTQNLPTGYLVQRNSLSGPQGVRVAIPSSGFLVFLEQVESIASLP